MIATVTAKGQVTLPAAARRRLGIKPGTRLTILVIDEERLEIIPIADSIASLKGMLPKPEKALSVEDMQRAIAEGAAR